MPSDETRRLLKAFGIAVTDFEDAVRNRSSVEEIRTAEAKARALLQEVAALIDQLHGEAETTQT